MYSLPKQKAKIQRNMNSSPKRLLGSKKKIPSNNSLGFGRQGAGKYVYEKDVTIEEKGRPKSEKQRKEDKKPLEGRG